MSYAQALEKLLSIGEEHLLDSWQSLNASQQEKLLSEIVSIDCATFHKQQQFLYNHLASPQGSVNLSYTPFTDFAKVGSLQDKAVGMQLSSEGKVGCLLVAGGQGSRLSFDAPKGTYPVTLVTKKSLFQLFAEKTIAAGKQARRLLPLAIMTSPQNHAATEAFFRDHHLFGLAPQQLFFFQQSELPFLSKEGHLILDKHLIAKGPDGNGTCLSHFVKSGIWEIWKRQGVEYINFVLVDNALADPFDAELIGFHAKNHAEITVKCTEKSKPEENVGLLVQTPEGVRIIEYSEINKKDLSARTPSGSLSYCCANISLFCFQMDFIKRAVDDSPLPWHLAYKNTSLEGPKGWKFEAFIFDYLRLAQTVKSLLYPRDQCFAPLKNSSGDDSLETVQQALLAYDRKIAATIDGYSIPDGIFELDPQFYYPIK